MWRDGERKLTAGKHLDDELLALLTRENQKVFRIVEGQEFEFRHDQMRAYLAARWAAHYEVQPKSLFERESENAIWRLSRGEQDEAWNFFADLYVAEWAEGKAAKDGATIDPIGLWKWSTSHPDRVILQQALQRGLKQTGHVPEMSS